VLAEDDFSTDYAATHLMEEVVVKVLKQTPALYDSAFVAEQSLWRLADMYYPLRHDALVPLLGACVERTRRLGGVCARHSTLPLHPR